jgi:hypothetical protein
MLRAFVNCAMVLTKHLNFFFTTVNFEMKEKDLIPACNEYSPQLSKLLYNWQLKNKEAVYTLKASQRMGGGRIFLKTFCTLSLMKTYQMSLFRPDPSRWTVPLSRFMKNLESS